MPLKYGTEIAGIPGCPPVYCARCSREAFRFAFEPLCEKSFLPVARMNPARKFSGDGELCSAHALSFFVTRETAVTKYNRLKAGHHQIGKTLGTHLARGRIEPADGPATNPSASGHFDLYEEDGCDLLSRFQIIERLL